MPKKCFVSQEYTLYTLKECLHVRYYFLSTDHFVDVMSMFMATGQFTEILKHIWNTQYGGMHRSGIKKVVINMAMPQTDGTCVCILLSLVSSF